MQYWYFNPTVLAARIEVAMGRSSYLMTKPRSGTDNMWSRTRYRQASIKYTPPGWYGKGMWIRWKSIKFMIQTVYNVPPIHPTYTS